MQVKIVGAPVSKHGRKIVSPMEGVLIALSRLGTADGAMVNDNVSATTLHYIRGRGVPHLRCPSGQYSPTIDALDHLRIAAVPHIHLGLGAIWMTTYSRH